MLLYAQPEDTQPFQRPGHRRPARRQRQRNGEGSEPAADCQRRHDQRSSDGGIAPQRKEREGKIKCAVAQRTQGRAIFPVPGHAVLHPETDQRRGKQQHAVDNLLPFFLRPQRQRHAQDAKYQRIGNQEQLADPIVFRLVVIQPPQAAHAERKQQPEQVQLAPVLPDADSENADGKQEIEREQRHKAAAPGGQQQRRKIPAEARQHGQAQRLLQHRQPNARRANHHQQRKGQRHRQHLPEPECAKHRQVEHAGRPALEDQRIDTLLMPQPPPDRQKDDGKQRRCHEAQLKREQGMFHGIAQQE